MSGIDLNELFVPTVSIAEVVLRGTVIYLIVFLILRFVPIRQFVDVRIGDILLAALIVDVALNSLSADNKSITDSLVLIPTFFILAYAIDWLYHLFPKLRLTSAAPLLLIKDGRLLYRNMRKEGITEDELMFQLRQHGVEAADQVKTAHRDADGQISLVMAKQHTWDSLQLR